MPEHFIIRYISYFICYSVKCWQKIFKMLVNRWRLQTYIYITICALSMCAVNIYGRIRKLFHLTPFRHATHPRPVFIIYFWRQIIIWMLCHSTYLLRQWWTHLQYDISKAKIYITYVTWIINRWWCIDMSCYTLWDIEHFIPDTIRIGFVWYKIRLIPQVFCDKLAKTTGFYQVNWYILE